MKVPTQKIVKPRQIERSLWKAAWKLCSIVAFREFNLLHSVKFPVKNLHKTVIVKFSVESFGNFVQQNF